MVVGGKFDGRDRFVLFCGVELFPLWCDVFFEYNIVSIIGFFIYVIL